MHICVPNTQDRSLKQLLMEDLLEYSATNLENAEEPSSSNRAGESYSKTFPVYINQRVGKK